MPGKEPLPSRGTQDRTQLDVTIKATKKLLLLNVQTLEVGLSASLNEQYLLA